MSRLLRPLAALALLAVASTGAAAQPRVRTVDPRPACSRCVVELERVVALGDTSGPGMVNIQGRVVRDGAGRWFVTSNGEPGVIKVFAPDGAWLATMGGVGRGPGELMGPPLVVISPGDTLHAIDPATHLVSVFSPALRFQRAVGPLVVPVAQAVALADGRLLVTGASRSRAFIGLPLHLLDRRGEVVRSFGTDSQGVSRGVSQRAGEPVDGGGFEARNRVIAGGAPGSGTVWAARTNAYVVERWDTAGRRVARLERHVEWFKPWRTVGPAGIERRPPLVTAVQERDGLLWVLLRVDDLEWAPRPPVPFPRLKDALWTPDRDMELLYDTLVEVIDLRTARLVASQRFRQDFLGLAAPGVVYSYEEDAEGNPRYVLWRLSLTTHTAG